MQPAELRQTAKMDLPPASTIGFYGALPSFNRFSRFVDPDPYHAVPDDWHVIITDVRGSTRAIEQGRYRDVNTVGAATIVVIQNVLGEFAFPYFFGGDGATLLVPTEHLPLVGASLLGLKALAQSAFQLELRVGAVPMSEVRRGGGIVEVSKFELTEGRSIAFLSRTSDRAATSISSTVATVDTPSPPSS